MEIEVRAVVARVHIGAGLTLVVAGWDTSIMDVTTTIAPNAPQTPPSIP